MAERSVLMVWGSADWGSLHRHIDAGRMPCLQRLIERGTSAPVATPPPLELAPMLATVATGLRADAHGVLAPVQVRADGGGVEATGRRSWRAPPFWEVLSGAGHPTITVNWPGTAGADRFAPTVVDDRFAVPSGAAFETWAVLPGSVNPAGLEGALAGLRVHPSDDLGPELAQLGAGALRPGAQASLRAMLARLLTVHAVTCHLAETRPWTVLSVFEGWLHHVRVGLAAEGPAGAAVVSRAHALQDAMLGRLVALAGPGATVTVASPNGLPDGAGPALARGMLVMAGPGIAADAMLPGVEAQDIAPTLLARHGLTVAADGRAIGELGGSGPRRVVETWAPGPAEDGPDPAAALLAEGYRDVLAPSQVLAMRRAERHARANAAVALLYRGDAAGAAAVLEEMRAQTPQDLPTLLLLGRCRTSLGDWAACETLGRDLLAIDAANPWGHLATGAWLAMTAGGAAGEAALARARALGGHDPELLVRLGALEMARADPAAARAAFEAAVALAPERVDALLGLAQALERLGDDAGAERVLRDATRTEPHLALAQLHLARLLLRGGRLREAIGRLETAAGQRADLHEAQSLLRDARQALSARIAAGRSF